MRTMLKRSRTAILLTGLTLLTSTETLSAQREPPVPPAQLLERFASEEGGQSAQEVASSAITYMLVHRAEYRPNDIRSLMDGLESLALQSGQARVRQSAIRHLMIPARATDSKPEQMFGRVKQIYERTIHPDVRAAIAASLGGISERKEAAAFLDRLARQSPGAEDFPDAPMTALRTLPGLGEEGRAVLKSLHESKAVQDPEARHGLSVLAEKGYRVPTVSDEEGRKP